jgi:hypothetical protein
MGVKAFAGTEHFLAELAVGTVPFVWRTTLGAGGSVTFLSPDVRVRPKLSVLWRSDVSSVVVWEPEADGKIQNDVAYRGFPGVALLAGAEVRLINQEGGSGWIEIAAGYRAPFAGLAEIQRTADAFVDRYGPTGHDVAVPRWDRFTVSLGVNARFGGGR